MTTVLPMALKVSIMVANGIKKAAIAQYTTNVSFSTNNTCLNQLKLISVHDKDYNGVVRFFVSP